ncbi:MAG: TlpA family protein disulfide reductase [Ruminococcaceae bacterium]|nr:TlpA family protein disulfide reductase [Oscillospiraceae bacterium]
MKNIWKWLIIAVVLIGVIVGATLLYNTLSKDYKNQNFTTGSQSESKNDKNPEEMLAPDFTVTDYNGKKVKLSDYRGKPVVVNFWATWCGYCKQEMPDFNTAYKKYPNVQFLMVNATDGVQETVDKAKTFIRKGNFEFPVVFDTEGQAVNNYYVTGFPATYFIDKKGNLVTYANGMLDLETLEKGINMINEK